MLYMYTPYATYTWLLYIIVVYSYDILVFYVTNFHEVMCHTYSSYALNLYVKFTITLMISPLDLLCKWSQSVEDIVDSIAV